MHVQCIWMNRLGNALRFYFNVTIPNLPLDTFRPKAGSRLHRHGNEHLMFCGVCVKFPQEYISQGTWMAWHPATNLLMSTSRIVFCGNKRDAMNSSTSTIIIQVVSARQRSSIVSSSLGCQGLGVFDILMFQTEYRCIGKHLWSRCWKSSEEWSFKMYTWSTPSSK